MGKWLTRRRWIGLGVLAALLTWYVFSLPRELFHVPYSTVIVDRGETLLNASIAADGQWRFPLQSHVPDKFAKAIVRFEDKRFRSHLGVDIRALGRALRQNVAAGKIVSGGSTLSMQVIRLARQNPDHTVVNKLVEMILATRLEWRYSKDEILALYAAHAPFGGNVVGLEAACWRYFGRQPDELSWGEAALLAVLPNNPSMINLGVRRGALKDKRDRLLRRLFDGGDLDSLSLDLALAEPIPHEPMPLPRLAPHLLDRALSEGRRGQRLQTTVDVSIQERVSSILWEHHQRLRGNQVFNAAALILDVPTGEALAYVGNVPSGGENHEYVDVIRSKRSTGSVLKPFLYAAMMNEGGLLPRELVPDIPTIINGFSPKNFTKQYDGAVSADQALIRSLNIPAVHELRSYRYEKFYDLLKNMGITTLDQPANHYGLALILGGAEATLWDVTGGYASMARTLNNYFDRPGAHRYDRGDIHAPKYLLDTASHAERPLEEHSVIDASSVWLTFQTLTEVYRPGEETGWQYFHSSKKIAWKTGTSFGFRDGWAVGVTPQYAIGVWVGNADGEGRPGLTGTETAAPILLELLSILPTGTQPAWFQKPASELASIPVCRLGGQRASEFCTEVDTMDVAKLGLRSVACTYHRRIHLTADRRFRVHAGCAPIQELHAANWFVLPPIEEYYYKSRHVSYRPLPPFVKGCTDPSGIVKMELIYPKFDSRIFIPRELDGKLGTAVFQAAHRDPSSTIYWHIDGEFLGTTTRTHRMTVSPTVGSHRLTLVDETGETLEKTFVILSER